MKPILVCKEFGTGRQLHLNPEQVTTIEELNDCISVTMSDGNTYTLACSLSSFLSFCFIERTPV